MGESAPCTQCRITGLPEGSAGPRVRRGDATVHLPFCARPPPSAEWPEEQG